MRQLALAALLAAFPFRPALAADEEIQVYMDEITEPGAIGLDIHNNYVLSGESAVDYPGQQRSLHRYRFTPEWSLGLTDTFDIGAYLPLVTFDHRGMFVDGVKLRAKWMPSRAKSADWFYGLNFEIGRVGHRLDRNPWNSELKGIVGFRSGRWTAATNANFGFKVSGPARAPAELEIATKVSYAVSRKTAIGIESYNGVGEVRHLGRFGDSEQTTYVALDTVVGKWDLNLGVGRGYGANPDKWIAKAIVGVPLNWSIRGRSKAD